MSIVFDVPHKCQPETGSAVIILDKGNVTVDSDLQTCVGIRKHQHGLPGYLNWNVTKNGNEPETIDLTSSESSESTDTVCQDELPEYLWERELFVYRTYNIFKKFPY